MSYFLRGGSAICAVGMEEAIYLRRFAQYALADCISGSEETAAAGALYPVAYPLLAHFPNFSALNPALIFPYTLGGAILPGMNCKVAG